MNYASRSIFKIVLLFITVFVSGCVRPAPVNDAPTNNVPNGGGLPEVAPTTEDFIAPTIAVVDDSAGEPDVTPTVTLFISVPTEPGAATETAEAEVTSTLPPIPTQTPTQAPLSESGRFDAQETYGQPQFDKATLLHLNNWMANSGDLPDDSNIQLVLDGDSNLHVTGKNAYFYTWWFSAPYIEEGYVEMEVRTGDTCEGKSGYGMILNGQEKGSTTTGSHGYVVMLSCDGFVFMDRLDATRDTDGSSVYAATNLFWWTEDENVQRGENKTNTLGVLIDEGEITIYVNGFVFYTVYDDTYSGGRLGMFVYPDETENFTYMVTDLTVWELGK